MAPFLRPRRLYDVCINSVAHMLNEVCEELGRKHGSYDVEECKRDVSIIREFLSSTMTTAKIIDDLYHKWRRETYDYDRRIPAAALMHKGMKTLTVLRGVDIVIDINTPYCESSFWISQLSYSKCITNLTLAGVCTDEILKKVSQYCFSLKHIDIASAKVEICKDLGTGMTRYLYLVTDIGLEHLGKCKTLQAVEMSSYYIKTMSVTVPGIRKLLKDLPVVKYMSFHNMGSVISEDMDDTESLKLTHFTENSPNVHHVAALSKLCHNLQHISFHFREKNHAEKATVLDAITKSEMIMSGFSVSNYRCDDIFADLLRGKGTFLVRLTLYVSISTVLIKIIGLYCPHICHLSISSWATYQNNMNVNFTLDKNTTIFSKLESLTLWGRFWDADTILQIILPHAFKLKKLNINTDFRTVENTINKILNKNPLNKLTTLDIDFRIHMPTLLYFIHLPHMTCVWFRCYTGYITESEVCNMLKEELKNRDISIGWSYCED